jgi:membrane protein
MPVSMIKDAWFLGKETFKEFNEDNAIHYAASLSYYTIFSLPPIMIIVINIASSLFGEAAVQGEIHRQLDDVIGSKSAVFLETIIQNASSDNSGAFAKAFGIIMLIIGATGVFAGMQDTLNIIWNVKIKPGNNLIKLLRDRILSFAMVLVIAFLLLVSMVIHVIIEAFSHVMSQYFKQITVIIIQVLNYGISLAVVTFLFAMIFKFLPDVKIRWRDVTAGALVTSVLFTIGKYLIGLYLSFNQNIGSAYGAASTVIIILLWVFFSSIILFLGAEFTQVFARKYNRHIVPADYAVQLKKKAPETPR